MWTGNKLKHDAWDQYYHHHPYLSDSRSRPAGDDSRSIRDASSSDDAGSYPREPLGSPFRMPPPLPPQEKLSDLQPRHLGRERRPTLCPDNLYGSRPLTSTERMSTREFEKLVDVSASSSPSPHNSAIDMAKMSQEWGAGLINFLLSPAVSSAPVLRLRTICYIEPVLAFGTEQDIIVNSRRLSPQRSKDQAVR
jgi:hypothetical protein